MVGFLYFRIIVLYTDLDSCLFKIFGKGHIKVYFMLQNLIKSTFIFAYSIKIIGRFGISSLSINIPNRDFTTSQQTIKLPSKYHKRLKQVVRI